MPRRAISELESEKAPEATPVPYDGEWVAVSGESVVARAATFEGLVEKVNEKNVDYVYQVLPAGGLLL